MDRKPRMGGPRSGSSGFGSAGRSGSRSAGPGKYAKPNQSKPGTPKPGPSKPSSKKPDSTKPAYEPRAPRDQSARNPGPHKGPSKSGPPKVGPKPAAGPRGGFDDSRPPRVSGTRARPPKPVEEDGGEDIARLHVRIAHSGLCSRRAAEKMIIDGRVTVNGSTVRELGVKVTPEDEIRVDGTPVFEAKKYTLILNKPTGCVTTLFDPQRRPTIVKYLPDLGVQLKPVGRLDMDTEGLLLVTNDGELAQRLAHPRYGVEKEYQVIIRGIPEEDTLNKLRAGIYIEGGRTKPCRVEVIHAEPKSDSTGLRMTLHEGRKRQIRLMCEAIGHPVISLKRLRIGPLYVKGLRAGECRMLGKAEVSTLRRMVGLPEDV